MNPTNSLQSCQIPATRTFCRVKRTLSLLSLSLTLGLGSVSAAAQTTADLQQQIQQMKQQYEQQISALEGRIASLEQNNRAMVHATQENTVSVTDLQAEVAKQVSAHEEPKLSRSQKTEIEQTELANTPQYDEVQDSEKVVRELQQQAKQFEFHGYLRSGQGLNGEGGQMIAFQAPGSACQIPFGQ